MKYIITEKYFNRLIRLFDLSRGPAVFQIRKDNDVEHAEKIVGDNLLKFVKILKNYNISFNEIYNDILEPNVYYTPKILNTARKFLKGIFIII